MTDQNVPSITVLGRDCRDMFTNEERGLFETLDGGPKLISKFLNDLKANQSKFKIIGNRPMIQWLIVDGQSEIHRQKSTDTVQGFDMVSQPSQRRNDELSPEDTIQSPFLVIDDPRGDLLNEDLPCLRGSPTVFYQTRSLKTMFQQPYGKPSLVKHIEAGRFKRFVVILDAEVLRQSGTTISRGSSWEKTVEDMKEFKPKEKMKLSPRDHGVEVDWVIRFAYEGAVVIETNSRNTANERLKLCFVRQDSQRDFTAMHRVHSSALETAFLSGLVSATASTNQNGSPDWSVIQDGLNVARNLAMDKSGGEFTLAYPNLRNEKCVSLAWPAIPEIDLGKWSILAWGGEANRKSQEEILDLATKVVTNGVGELNHCPIAKFRKYISVDRWQIQRLHEFANEVEDYLREKDQEKPLSLAVFGAPGSGKSFIVNEIVEGIKDKISHDDSEKERFPVWPWNLSQLLDYRNLLVAFQNTRDAALNNRIPVVLFDEFDTSLNGELGWLKYFLAPMNDGEFFDHDQKRPIGRAIFIFVGGTASTFENFKNDTATLVNQPSLLVPTQIGVATPSSGSSLHGPSPPDNSHVRIQVNERANKAVKKPDFVGRLDGHLDIDGYDKPRDDADDYTFMIRRAILIRSSMDNKWGKEITLSTSDIHRLLRAEKYTHGARSINAIIKKGRVRDKVLSLPEKLAAHLRSD